MKTSLINSLSRSWLLLAAGIIGLAATANAATYTWRGTNSSTWTTPGNWLALSVGPTGSAGGGHRLDVNNNTNNGLVYDASLGTTIYGTNGIRGFAIGSGSLSNGTLTITGGSFITATNNGGDIIGNSDNNTGILNVNGGTFYSGSTVLALGLGGGVNRTSTLNVNSGSATAGGVFVNTLRGTINLNGGTFAVNGIVLTNIPGLNSTNNFNGGILKARTNATGFMPAAPNSVTRAQIRNGGAIIDTDGFNITIAQPLIHSTITGDAAVDGGLTKNSAGTLTLSAVPTYTGPTRVNAGRLTTPLPTLSSALVLADGSRFTPTLTNAPWLAGSAALTNTTIDFNYGSFAANPVTSARFYLTNIVISGLVTCNIAGTGFPVTNITLLSYSSKTGGGAFVLGSLPNGAAATLNDDGANVTLSITTPSVQNLIWSTGDGIWQTNGGLNWNGNSVQYLEYPSGNNDVVTFNDTASGTVTITGQVNPGGTTVDTTTGFFNFTGTGSIGGTNGITKTGTSVLTINNANNFTGPVTVSGGTLFVNNNAALGATNGAVTVNGPANTLTLGTPSGNGIAVSNKTVTINGTGVGGSRGALRGGSVAAGQTNIWAGPVIVGASQARIGTEDNGNIVVAGPITDAGANLSLLLRPGINGVITLAASGSSYPSTFTFGDANTSYVKLGANDALCTNLLNHGPGYLDLNGFNQTVGGINENTGAGKVINNGATVSILTVYTGTNSSSAFSTSGDLLDGPSATFNLVKSGKGTQTFGGPNVLFSGTTTIADGQLNLTSANPMNTAITVQAGGTLGGEGTTTNSLTFQANATLSLNPSTPGSFTANTIDATASPIKVLLTTTTTNDALALNAPNGITGSAANFQVVGSRGGSFYLTNGNTQLMFAPSTVNASLVWKGNNGTSPTLWDTLITTNWINGANPDAFYAGDNVIFNDTANTYTVNLSGTPQPSSVTVNATNNYSFTGALGGGGTVTKGGTGTLTLNNNNNYTGLTLITNGVVNVQANTALGTTASGTIINNSGTLDFGTAAVLANALNIGAEVLTISGNGFNGQGTIVNNSPVSAPQINAAQQIVLADNASIGGSARWDVRGPTNAINMGTFTLTKVGGNQVTLVGTTVNNPGNINVNSGMFSIETSANLGGAATNIFTVNNGGAVNFYQSTVAPVWTLILNSGATFSATSGNGVQNHWAGPVTLNGAATLDCNGGHIYVDGQIAGVGSIVKVGSSGATLNASNAYTGNTTVSSGILNVAWPTFAAGSTISVSNGATLNLTFSVTNTVAAIVFNGTNQPAGVYNATTGAPFITGTGALQIVSAGPPTMTFTNTGSNLVITFANGTLQAQTNSLGSGLGTNWVSYPGTSPVTVPVDPANGAVFFRVKQ